MQFEEHCGMESLNREFDEVIRLTTGMEAIALAGEDGQTQGFEARYAQALVNIELDFAGQEGFVDTLKRGATKIYQWIKDLIKMIRGWLNDARKRFDIAKRHLSNLNWVTDKFKDIKQKGIMALATKSPNTQRIVRRFDDKDRGIINEALAEANNEVLSAPVNTTMKIIGSALDPIANMIGNKLNGFKSRVEEINRLDPEGYALKQLGLSGHANYLTSGVVNSGDKFMQEDQAQFTRRIERLVVAAEEAQKELATATANLDKLNEANAGHSEQQHQMSRLATIVKHLTAISDGMTTLVIDIDGALYKAIKNQEAGVVREAMNKAKGSVSEAAQEYIDQLNAEFNIH